MEQPRSQVKGKCPGNEVVDGNFECKFYTFIIPNQGQLGPLTGVEPAIPVQRSNQLSYRETDVEL